MSSTNLKTGKSEDPLKQAIENNPCGKCRARRLPICKCGGGGGGGGSPKDKSEKDASNELGAANLPSTTQRLLKSALWSQPDSWELIFEFKSLDELVDLKLDLEQGILTLSCNKELTEEQQKELDELINAIKNEFTQFKMELVNQGISFENMQLTHHENNLIIRINSPKYFDDFIQRLFNKNLLVTQAPTLQNDKQDKYAATPVKSMNTKLDPEPNYKSTAPTPFDMIQKLKY